MSMFSGVTIPKMAIVKFWRVWMYPLDPFVRLVGGMIATELQGRNVVCQGSELHYFNPPSGHTCGDYARAFIQTAGGYITNESATSQCGYCQYQTGQQFFQPLDIYFSERWMNLVSTLLQYYFWALSDPALSLRVSSSHTPCSTSLSRWWRAVSSSMPSDRCRYLAQASITYHIVD
jgi:ABC-type multidrug transport system permease subunit